MAFYVYMLASKRNGTLYIGMTDDLLKRVWMHRDGILPGFTRDYGVKHLVWYEAHASRESALVRERADEEVESLVEDRTHRGRELAMARFG